MSATRLEGKIKNGQIVLSEELPLPDQTDVYVIVSAMNPKRYEVRIRHDRKTKAADSTKTNQRRRTLWEKIRPLIEQVPNEEWTKLPTDGSINVDHYLYGHKKRSK